MESHIDFLWRRWKRRGGAYCYRKWILYIIETADHGVVAELNLQGKGSPAPIWFRATGKTPKSALLRLEELLYKARSLTSIG